MTAIEKVGVSGAERLSFHSDGSLTLLSHGGNDGDEQVLSGLELGLDILSDLGVGEGNIVLSVSLGGHEVEESIVDVDELVLLTEDVGNLHVVGGGGELLKLLVGEDVGSDQVDLGVTVLSGLGGGHVDDLAKREGV